LRARPVLQRRAAAELSLLHLLPRRRASRPADVPDLGERRSSRHRDADPVRRRDLDGGRLHAPGGVRRLSARPRPPVRGADACRPAGRAATRERRTHRTRARSRRPRQLPTGSGWSRLGAPRRRGSAQGPDLRTGDRRRRPQRQAARDAARRRPRRRSRRGARRVPRLPRPGPRPQVRPDDQPPRGGNRAGRLRRPRARCRPRPAAGMALRQHLHRPLQGPRRLQRGCRRGVEAARRATRGRAARRDRRQVVTAEARLAERGYRLLAPPPLRSRGPHRRPRLHRRARPVHRRRRDRRARTGRRRADARGGSGGGAAVHRLLSRQRPRRAGRPRTRRPDREDARLRQLRAGVQLHLRGRRRRLRAARGGLRRARRARACRHRHERPSGQHPGRDRDRGRGAVVTGSRGPLIDVAMGYAPADAVIVGGRLVDVHTGTVREEGVAIKDGRVAAVGDVDYTRGDATRVLEADGQFLVPGLVDPHLHQWHTYTNSTVFAAANLLHGTTAVCDGFYGHAILTGVRSVRFFLDELKATPVKPLFVVPTLCYSQNRFLGIPVSPNAPTIGDLHEMLSWDETVGVEETGYELLLEPERRDHELLAFLEAALRKRAVVSGHGAGLPSERAVNAYLAAGVANNHELVARDEARRQAELGLVALIREGASCSDVRAVAQAITADGLESRAFLLCPDVVTTEAMFDVGQQDECIRVAIRNGLTPMQAVQLSTIQPAEHLRVSHDVGVIAAGRYADVVFVDELEDFAIRRVVANGEVVVE